MDEILLPYVQICARANMVPNLEGFYDFADTQESQNFQFLYKSVFSCGVRRNNHDFLMAGRSVVTDLFYGFNCTMYQELEFKDCRARFLASDQLNSFITKYEAFSVGGNPSKGDGRDFILETMNRRTKRWLPPGYPLRKSG